MKVYRLRDKNTQEFYIGKGIFRLGKGKIYTSKGHIKNSITQTYGSLQILKNSGRDLEIIEYDMNELNTEAL
jgi:hypothetical protein